MGENQPFLDAGFRAFKEPVLVAETVHLPPYPNTVITIRALTTDSEWAAAFALHLLYHASCYGFQQLGAQRLVIVPGAEYNAAQIYAAVGYRQQEWQAGLSWWEGIE